MSDGDMTDRLLIEVAAGGRISVSIWPGGEEPAEPVAAPTVVDWPMDSSALADLRWYLEDYLRTPYGVYGDHGARVAGEIAAWGHAGFAMIFGSEAAGAAYRWLRSRDAPVEVVVRSSAPEWLRLPWELMHDPDRPSPLALDQVGISRALPGAGFADPLLVAGERLRVLMVISRPSGPDDIGYRIIARPLLERLAAVRGAVDLVVLRPPTIDRLRQVLTDARRAGEPFHIVHFDGHGLAAPGERTEKGSSLSGQQRQEQAVLLFESATGGRDDVPAATVAQVVTEGAVPVVVLNACQSGAVGKELETAVATRLLQEGAASVVAMAYAVYAVAAAEFMTELYERLFTGGGVGEAVAAGRRRLAQRNERPSARGPIPLADWMVPVHYTRRDVRFPDLRVNRDAPLSLDAVLDQLRADQADGDDRRGPLAAVDQFVGRDSLIYTLEQALRWQGVVVLHGAGGTGKTELAKAFGRWWRATGGVAHPSLVVWHSFEPGVASFGLDSVVAAIGLQVFGAEFARLEDSKRREVVIELLTTRRLLLVWDNFESVRTMPDPTGATPALDAAEQAEMRSFLDRVGASGASAVIITSRTEEPWLGPVRRIAVAGLTPAEAVEYADQVLAPYPAARPRRALPAFVDLMTWLDGHPLCMRLVLPHLESTEPADLLAALTGTVPLPTGYGDTRTTSLDTSVTYSVAHLSQPTRQMLVVLTLLYGVADVDVLGAFSVTEGVPGRFAGYPAEAWRDALEEAARLGLLRTMTAGEYRIHPALPAFAAQLWQADDPTGYPAERAAAERALLEAHARFGGWLRDQIDSGDARTALAIVGDQRRTLGSLLSYALRHEMWNHAYAVADPLDRYWGSRGLVDEARRWTDRVRLTLEDAAGTPPGPATPAGALWLYFMNAQGIRDMDAGHLDHAEQVFTTMCEQLTADPAAPQHRDRLAVAYRQLGQIALLRQRADEAEKWARQALSVAGPPGDRANMARTWDLLGGVATLRGRWDEAETWRRRTLALLDQVGDRRGSAVCLHSLGVLAARRNRTAEAEAWQHGSLAIWRELQDRPGMASSYHELGVIEGHRERWHEARLWYHRSLAISEELGDRTLMAKTYFQLGIIAQAHDRHFDEAEQWYRRSLAIEEELGDRPGTAFSYGQLGLLAEVRGDRQQALEWLVRSVIVSGSEARPSTGPGLANLARIAARVDPGSLDRAWLAVTGETVPEAVRELISAAQVSTGGDQSPMADPIDQIARAAAQQLSAEYGQDLVSEVEAALSAQENRDTDRYLEPMDVANLVVSIASLVWSVYLGLRQDKARPSSEVVARTVRVRLDETLMVETTLRDRLVEISVDQAARVGAVQEQADAPER
ncbi:tetratricopeptide repeat protein [Plantactinospora sp. WMMC1484]|uniref:CHAT domain-containing tetratricopeptide repeat protein n=1 Tax=Plantactinospora sp. WMMC1484 TaxID=3404122 RepID=UPI003BF53DA7